MNDEPARGGDPVSADIRFFEDGVLHEINRLVLHPRGLALGIGLTDGRALLLDAGDDEGWVFEHVDPGKVRAFAERHPVAPRREEALGFVVQPTAGEETQ